MLRWTISGTADFVFNYYLTGRAISKEKLLFENRGKVRTANWQVSNLLSWPRRNAQGIATLEQSIGRITSLENKIRALPNELDQINCEFINGDQLILEKLEVGIDGRVLVAIKELRLDLGKVYAMTGETGCGKTSLLSKIKGLKENKIFGRGNIYYPKVNGSAPKIVTLNQQDYFPLNSTLEEIICYPEEPANDLALNKNKQEQMFQLLQEIGLKTFDGSIYVSANKQQNSIFDQKRDWYTSLSGGEKKKIMLVSAIIKKPDVLILDEIFNGLDEGSIKVVQKMLKKYLPGSLILVVDHHAKDNNYNNFYDWELHFADKNIVVGKGVSI